MLLGVDIGGTKCALILAENDGTIQKRIAFATSTVDQTLEWICSNAKLWAEKWKIQSVGISCGGPLDSTSGVIYSPPNLPGWDSIEIVKLLSESTGAPAFLCNDANACALAEWKYGAGKGCQNMVFLTFGTGLGAGLILNGALYEGTTGMAGEVGHIRLANDGPIGFGKKGSFEGFCSGNGIAKLGKMMINGEEKLTAKSIAEAADKGDEKALEVYRVSGEYLGRGLSIIIDILNPEVIAIGSVYTRSEKLFAESMKKEIEKEALKVSYDCCKILPATLGENIGDYAAVSTALLGVENYD